MHWWWPWLFLSIFFFLSLLQHFLGGCLPSQSYKANRVVWTQGEIRVNMGCCDVCVVSEWPCVVDIPDIEPLVLFFFLPGEMFSEALSPHPGLTCWAMTTKQMASIAAQCDLWPLSFELPCREGLFEKPSWFNNIFYPGAAKVLSCLTPVAPSLELQHNCSYLPYIPKQ